MTCYPNGANPLIPVDPVVRRLVQERDYCTNAATQTIALDYTVIFELVMEQWTLHTENVPTITGNADLIKQSGDDARNTTLLRRVNLFTENVQDLVCVIPFRFVPGDHVIITFPNPDDEDVGTEFLGIELIP